VDQFADLIKQNRQQAEHIRQLFVRVDELTNVVALLRARKSKT
jgi:hypothetical protein